MENKFNNFRFITADDHSIITRSLSLILKDLYPHSEVYQLHKITEIVDLLNETKIDLLLLDISFQDGDSLQAITTLKKIQPKLKILIYSGHDEDIYAICCINAGANGYLSKLSSFEETQKAILAVMNSDRYFSENIQGKINDSFIFNKPVNPIENLSSREFEVAKLIAEGYGNTEICMLLDLQKSTVSTYKNRVFEKLEIKNLTDLIKIFNVYNLAH